MFLTKRKMKWSFLLLFGLGTTANAQYYNADYKMAPYSDPQTIESNVDIGGGELITVGTVNITEFGSNHKDVVLTRLNKEGKVIWNMRYGYKDLDEVGNGITLSWDKKHVIVVGSLDKAASIVEKPSYSREALVLKIRISDGALIWTTLHGVDDYDDQAFLIKRSNSFEDPSYVVVGSSSGHPDQSFERMYAFKIKESGDEIWTNRYLLSDNFPFRAIRPTSMVENGYASFMIAGTRHEVNRPTQIFTIGISTFDGSLTDNMFHYPIDPIYHVSTVDIDRHPDGKGYAVSFTARDFKGICLMSAGDPIDEKTDRIGVMRLNEDRKVLWSSVYWEKYATNQNGLSIRFYKDELHVCVNITRKKVYNTPGFLRLKESNGSVLGCITHHIPASVKDYGPVGNHMIRDNADKEYYIKSVYEKWGFSIVNTDISGKADCAEETRIYKCAFKTEPKEQKCEPKDYGKYWFKELPYDKLGYGEDICKSKVRVAEESTESAETNALPVNKALVYPSPVAENQEMINLKLIADLDATVGTIAIYNSMGQQVFSTHVTFIKGENNYQFNASQFTSGIYMIAITAGGEMVDQVKFIKN